MTDTSTLAGSGRASGLGRYFTVLQGIRPFDKSLLSRDVVAGITLAALAIPEVMGYTKIAGTPVITGLYTILLPALAFAVLGSSRHLVVGGDSATAAIMYAGIAGLGISGLEPGTSEWLAYASLAALITGGLLILARVARLGFLADFISRTVLVGFLTGVGVQVALGQFAGMLGVASPKVNVKHLSGTVIKFWDTLKEIPDTSLATLAVSLAVIATLVVFEKWIPMIPGGLVAVVGAIAVSWGFDLEAHGVSTLGKVPSGLPSLGFPSGVGWSEVGPLLATCVSMFLVIIAQSAATSRAYAVKYKEHFEENTDIVGLAAASLAAGLSNTFVVNGSPTKSKMAEEAKAASQVAMLAMAAMVAIVLLFLTKPLQYMPNAVLAAVVFVIGVKLIDWKHMVEIYGSAARRVLDRRRHGRCRGGRRRRAGRHPRDRALVARPRETALRPARLGRNEGAGGRADDRPCQGRHAARARARRVPVRRRPLLRQRGPVDRGGGRPRGRARAAPLARLARRRDRRRRLHGRQDPGRARRPTEAAGRCLCRRRTARGRRARTRAVRAHGQDRSGSRLRVARRGDRRLPRRDAGAVAVSARNGAKTTLLRGTPHRRPLQDGVNGRAWPRGRAVGSTALRRYRLGREKDARAERVTTISNDPDPAPPSRDQSVRETLESAWPPAAAVLLLIALNLTLTVTLHSNRGHAPRWLIPGFEAVLLVVLILRGPTGTGRRATSLRRASMVLVWMLAAVAMWATVVLVVAMIRGGKETNSAGILLAYGAFVWVGNSVAFALLYWEFDGGGPATRSLHPHPFPDLAFPQQLNPGLAAPGWRPIFWDYLHVGFTNSLAFSPTDVLPLARWAKLAMSVQAVISVAIIGLVIARAVNIFK